MKPPRRRTRILIVFLGLVPLAVAASYVAATRVDAYHVAARVIETDPVIRERFPGVTAYRLAFLNGYRIGTFGTSAEARYRFVLTADAAQATLDVVLDRDAGRWSLTEGSLRLPSGEAIPLEPRPLDSRAPGA